MPTDPVLIRAREIASEAYRDENYDSLAQDILIGKRDDSLCVKAVIVALKEGMDAKSN